MLSHFSVQRFAAPWTVAHQAPLSVGIFRQEHWSGLPCPPPGDPPHPGAEPVSLPSPALADGFFTTKRSCAGFSPWPGRDSHRLSGCFQEVRASQVVLVVKNPSANAGVVRDTGSILGWEDSPGGGHGNPLQCSCLENPHGQKNLAGYSPKDLTSWTRLK